LSTSHVAERKFSDNNQHHHLLQLDSSHVNGNHVGSSLNESANNLASASLELRGSHTMQGSKGGSGSGGGSITQKGPGPGSSEKKA
jgi:hypothetical protein